ncbi:MAG: hypothetical protein C4570_00220 [Ammonifex sp.]|jgi:hypothetical protein|nr:MAG: hypothetical protein C4570_00220 [Ammonifex sp.]
MLWRVIGAKNPVIVKGPAPILQEFKQSFDLQEKQKLNPGKLVEWILWERDRPKIFEPEAVVGDLPKPGDKKAILAFWKTHGPLVADYTPSWCKRCRQQWQDAFKMTVYAAPLSWVDTALTTLYLWRLWQREQKRRTVEGWKETGETMLFLQNLHPYFEKFYNNLPSEHKVKPPKEILLLPEGASFTACLKHNVPGYLEPYLLRWLQATKGISLDFKLKADISFSPTTVTMPCLYPVLAEHILTAQPQTHELCPCGCGHFVLSEKATYASDACRKKIWARKNKKRNGAL